MGAIRWSNRGGKEPKKSVKSVRAESVPIEDFDDGEELYSGVSLTSLLFAVACVGLVVIMTPWVVSMIFDTGQQILMAAHS